MEGEAVHAAARHQPPPGPGAGRRAGRGGLPGAPGQLLELRPRRRGARPKFTESSFLIPPGIPMSSYK